MLKQAAFDLFGIDLSPEQVALFENYARELAAWNSHTNLTAIIEPDAVRVRHFLDSLSVVRAVSVQPGLHVLDVGTGAGFPGLPLHIAVPGLHTTLMEATGKKIAFLDHLVARLGLENVKTLHARAEEAAHLTDQRASYDLVLARAVARLPGLLEYLLPFARIGGHCVAMKGATAFEEADDSKKALEILGGKLEIIVPVELPEVAEKHYLVVVEKIAKTPAAYPRKPGIPTRKPIGED
jgi:16S rRNA (guanine527-N7)-methyltransferase